MLVTMVSALEGESITVQFYNQNGNAVDKTINSNGIVEGEITLLGGQSVKLPTKNVTAGSSFNWRTEDGRAWEGGSTVTFYEDVTLFPITAIDISTPEEMHTYMPKGSTVRLLNDIYFCQEIIKETKMQDRFFMEKKRAKGKRKFKIMENKNDE